MRRRMERGERGWEKRRRVLGLGGDGILDRWGRRRTLRRRAVANQYTISRVMQEFENGRKGDEGGLTVVWQAMQQLIALVVLTISSFSIGNPIAGR